MPLLKGRFLTPLDFVKDSENGGKIYTIEHTGETFKSKDEYEKKLRVYDAPLWTCQCTGHINLKHKEAVESEKKTKEHVKEKFPEVFEKTVLEIVHHTSDTLDALVDRASLQLYEYMVPGETVSLKLKAANKTITGIILRADPQSRESLALQKNQKRQPVVSDDEMENINGSSPSSDKENRDKGNTPKKGAANKDDPPKSPYKGLPKLAPCKYSFKLDGEDKIINGIPAEDIQRICKIPSKDLLKLFIRCYATRGGYFFNSPWIVEVDMCQKYAIKDRITEDFVSTKKRFEHGRKAFEDTAVECAKSSKAKRSSTSSLTSPARYGTGKKHAFESKSETKTDSKKGLTKQMKLNFSNPGKTDNKSSSPRKKHSTPKKEHSTPQKVVQVASSTDDSDIEEISLAELKARTPTKSPRKTPRKTPTNTPRKKSTDAGSSSEDEDLPLSKLKESQSNEKPKTKVKKDKDKKKREKLKEKTKDGKKLKQATLFDMKTSKSKSSGSSSKPGTPVKKSAGRPPSQPPMVESPEPFFKVTARHPPLVTRLLKEVKKKDSNKNVVIQLAVRCAKELTEKQRKHLPAEVAELVQSKWEKQQEKKKLAKMTPEERKAYFKQKYRKKLKQVRKEKKRTICEDTELKLKNLPPPKLVPTPDGVPNELFGDIVMLTEFINCYRGLFMPDDEYPLYTDALMKAISTGKEGFAYVSQTLTVMLQTLLQDELASDYKELTVPLSEIPVNPYTTSEMVRLCLRKKDTDDVSNPESEDSVLDDDELEDLPDELLERLENFEMCELNPDEKLQILMGLCHRLMSTYSVQDYMQEKIAANTELWKKRVKILKDKNDQLKKEKIKLKEEKAENKQKEEKKDTKEDKTLTLDKFYGAKDSGVEDSEPEDLASVVKNRRQNAAKEKADRLERDKLERIKREEEYEKNRQILEREKVEKMFVDSSHLAKLVQRASPIGTDRHHNRYWVFTNSTPGLYVEKGWAWKDIDYSVRPSNAVSDSDDSSSSEEESEQEQDKDKKGKIVTKVTKCRDKTFPHKGQNLWFVYDNEQEISNLVDHLCQQGVRESVLRQEIVKNKTHISDILNKAKKEGEVKLVEPMEDLAIAFREELLETENKVRAGGLGGVTDFDKWEKKLNAATTIEEYGECLKETQDNIFDKFLEGMIVKKAKRSKLKPSNPDNHDTLDEEGKDSKEENENSDSELKDNEEKEVVDDLVPVGKIKWQETVGNCTTFSRLHVLLGILDSCIKWEKSAENAKCKICKKKGDEDMLLLCDDCNNPFHMYCLRPRLEEVPTGEWFCASCVPPEQRRRSRVSTRQLQPNTKEEENYGRRSRGKRVTYEEEVSSEEEIVHDTECIVCSGDEQLILCSTCPSAFHLDCHNPVLKREPRSNWRCQQCTTGIKIRKSRRAAARKRKRYDDDFVEDWESDEDNPRKRKKTEEEIVRVDTSKSRSERYKNRYGEEEKTKEEESESESDEEFDGEDTKQLEQYLLSSSRRSSRPTKRQSYNTSQDEDMSDEDQEEPVVKNSRRSSGAVNNDLNETPKTPPKKKKPRSKPRINGEVDSHVLEMKHAQEILSKLRRHKHSWPFQDPVDKAAVPDYYEIVEKPMDFSTIKKKFDSDGYKKVADFIDDLAQVFTNCELYNKPDSEVYKCIAPLEKIVRENVHRLLPGVCYLRNGNPMADHDYL